MSLRPILLAALASLPAVPAAAQWYDRGYGAYGYNSPPPISPYNGAPIDRARPLPPFEIVDRLEDQGYDEIGRPRFDGSVYVVEATGPGDRPVRLVVDAFRGRVIDRIALGGGARPPEMGEFDPRRPREFGVRPQLPAPPATGYYDPEPRPLREAARPEPRARAAPADPRLAPGPDTSGRSGADRAPDDRREAARSEPPARAGRPYGVNPDTSAPRRRPTEEASRPKGEAPQRAAPAESPTAPPPSVGRPAAAQPSRSPGTAVAVERPNRAVRVIEGVTPMNPDAGSGTRSLDALPKPPDVAPPVGTVE